MTYSILRRSFTLSLMICTLVIFAIHAQTVKLKIIETSDVHGSLFPFDFINNKEINTSLAQIYTYVKEQRAEKDQKVVLLDDGDILQGQPVVYYYNFDLPVRQAGKTNVPHICSLVMNYMKYDAGTVGNHDIEPGHPVYDKIRKEFNFPWLAANAVIARSEKNKTGGEPYFKPYTIIKRDKIKIAVLGMVTPAIPNWLPKDIWKGIIFKDMVETAERWIKIIKAKEKPDLIVGLFHSGAEDEGKAYDEGRREIENASRLVAEHVAGFDIVFAGHDHKVWNISVKNSKGKDVLILDPANAARHAAVAEVVMNYNKTTHSWDKEIKGSIVDSKNYKPDEDYMKRFEPVIEEVKNYVSKPIGTFTKTISSRQSIFGNSAFVDLIQRVQLDVTHADVSFASPLSFNAEIKKGTVYVRDMFNLYKYENLLYTMELTGKEIKDYLEYSYGNWFNTMKDANDHLLKFTTDGNGNILEVNGRPALAASYYNFSSAAGINYTVDVSKPAGSRITITSFSNGKPFELNKRYTVAVNSYQGNGGGGHLTEGAKIPQKDLAGRVIRSTQKDVRFYLMKWIEQKKTVTPEALSNWKVVPHDWWEKGRIKDSKILFEQ